MAVCISFGDNQSARHAPSSALRFVESPTESVLRQNTGNDRANREYCIADGKPAGMIDAGLGRSPCSLCAMAQSWERRERESSSSLLDDFIHSLSHHSDVIRCCCCPRQHLIVVLVVKFDLSFALSKDIIIRNFVTTEGLVRRDMFPGRVVWN